MMRGSANEEPVIEHLRNMPFVKEVYDVGMLALTQRPELAFSPDGIAILKMDNSIGMHLGGDGDFEVDGYGVCIAPVEVKTKMSPNTLGTAIGLTCADTLLCFPGDSIFQKYVEPEHLTQVAQQATILGAKLAVDVMASETGVLYVVILRIPDSFKQVCQQALTKVSEHAVRWAHTAEGQIPQFAPRDSVDIIRSRWSFWRVVNEHVKANGPFLPLKLFKHARQSFYSKTKGGVDGATEQRAILRSSTSHLQWEQKLVTQLLKTVCINAFIGWRIFERRYFLQSFSDFNSLERYLNALKKVQSTADFMLDAALDLLAHAQAIHASEDTEEEPVDSVGVDKKRALVGLAARRKRRRILFFNSEKGVKLRLSVTGHIPTTAKNLYCVLCGQNSDSVGKGWRGHRTSIKCNICSVHLCVQVHPVLRKSCWYMWHSNKELVPRITPHTSKDSTVIQESEGLESTEMSSTVGDTTIATPSRRSV